MERIDLGDDVWDKLSLFKSDVQLLAKAAQSAGKDKGLEGGSVGDRAQLYRQAHDG